MKEREGGDGIFLCYLDKTLWGNPYRQNKQNVRVDRLTLHLQG
jgi:hypothetical protein